MLLVVDSSLWRKGKLYISLHSSALHGVNSELEAPVFVTGKAPQWLFQYNLWVGLETDQEAVVKEYILL
jgi:hypothetical protein